MKQSKSFLIVFLTFGLGLSFLSSQITVDDEYEDLYFSASATLLETRLRAFADDPLNPTAFDYLFFNGIVIYEDYENTISDLAGIRSVVYYESFFLDGEVYIVVELEDGRQVGFYLMVDPDTLQFIGAFG